jgi:hypothetical protein
MINKNQIVTIILSVILLGAGIATFVVTKNDALSNELMIGSMIFVVITLFLKQ